MGTLVVLLLAERPPLMLKELLLIGESMIGMNISGIPLLIGVYVRIKEKEEITSIKTENK